MKGSWLSIMSSKWMTQSENPGLPLPTEKRGASTHLKILLCPFFCTSHRILWSSHSLLLCHWFVSTLIIFTGQPELDFWMLTVWSESPSFWEDRADSLWRTCLIVKSGRIFESCLSHLSCQHPHSYQMVLGTLPAPKPSASPLLSCPRGAEDKSYRSE